MKTVKRNWQLSKSYCMVGMLIHLMVTTVGMAIMDIMVKVIMDMATMQVMVKATLVMVLATPQAMVMDMVMDMLDQLMAMVIIRQVMATGMLDLLMVMDT